MKLYMVRHVQSETNLEGRYTGWAQVSLTEKGIADGQKAGEYLKGRSFDRIYASDLLRAVQTAQAAIPGCEPVLLSELREISVGRLERRKVAECEAEYGSRFWITPSGYDFTPYGGENENRLRERVQTFLRKLEQEDGEQVIAFAHAGVIQCALDLVLGQRLDRTRIPVGNGSVAIFAYENERWRLETWGAKV